MNVWILSVRELTRLLRGRLTWLAAALTVLSPGGADGVPVRLGRHDAVPLCGQSRPGRGRAGRAALCPAYPLRLRPYLPLPGGRRSATRRCPL